MLCSPIKLFMDIILWSGEGFLDNYKERYANNKSANDNVGDCDLFSMPCASNATASLLLDQTKIFWFDLLAMYVANNVVNFVGIFGNVVNIIIFRGGIYASSTDSLLLALAVTDLLILISNFIIHNSVFLCALDTSVGITTYNLLWGYGLLVFRTLNLLSLDLITVLSFQRAIAVLLPFKVSRVCSPRNTKITIACLVILFLAGAAQMSISSHHQWFYHHYFNQHISIGFAGNGDSGAVFLYLTTRSSVGSALILTFSVITGHGLKRQAKKRISLRASSSSSSSSSASESSMTPRMTTGEIRSIRMALTICLLTFVVYTCAIISNTILHINFGDLLGNTDFIITTFSLYLLFSINSCSNFFIYVIMSHRFKNRCKLLLFRRRC